MKYIKLFESFKRYTEIEFVCSNSEFENSTSENDQLNLYNDLRKVERILPYMQDWSDDNMSQKSLAVIILDEDMSEELIKTVKDLAKKHNVEIDMFNSVDEFKVNSISNGTLENLV